jgi:hypothetical protein
MNLVVVTSVIHADSGKSVFNSDERLSQLLNKTISSIRLKIPNSHIVLLEGSKINDNEYDIIESFVDEIYFYDIKGLNKTEGELSLILNYYQSDNFKLKYDQIDNLIKISGRYYFLDNFNFDLYDGSVIKSRKADWTNQYVCETRYYKVAKKDIMTYIMNLKKIIVKGIYYDIEHSFFAYNIVPCKHKINKLGLGGLLAPTGEYIED